MKRQPALLATADGATFRGFSVGALGTTSGEAVFNTAMAGYQEIFTDPSYAGQVVVMTSPHIGNYGVNKLDEQARRPWVSGIVAKRVTTSPSSWRSEGAIGDFFLSERIVGIEGVDTRRLTRHLRSAGAMPVAIGADVDEAELLEMAAAAPPMEGQDLASTVTTPVAYRVDSPSEPRGLVAAFDLGIKRDILAQLSDRGYAVEVLPCSTPVEEVLKLDPDGIFLSNGPGDPEPLTGVVSTVAELIGKVPVFGICLGHQVLGLALGASTYKLKFGHHGGNHPVQRLSDNRVEITSQNHGFSVDLDVLKSSGGYMSRFGTVEPTHRNLNDGTLEGMRLKEGSAFSVQYHPEAAPGPNDAVTLFDDFVDLMERTT